MKYRIRGMLAGIVFFGVTSTWIYLYMNSHAIIADEQNNTLGMLKDLKQMDSDWNADVLKSQAEINLSYDPLTQPLHKISDIIELLDAKMTERNDAELTEAVSNIRSIFGEKTTLIDSFKAQNAVLKNSLRYAPTAYKNIENQLRSKRDMQLSSGTQLMHDFRGAFDELEKSFSTSSNTDSVSENRKVETALNKLKEVHKSQDLAQIDPAVTELNNAWTAASEELYKATQGGAQPGAEDAGGQQQSTGGTGENVTDAEYEEVK